MQKTGLFPSQMYTPHHTRIFNMFYLQMHLCVTHHVQDTWAICFHFANSHSRWLQFSTGKFSSFSKHYINA